MENKKFVIDCRLGVLDYVTMVNSIANDYFDEDGTYTPHIGKLNVMRLFYNNCVKDGKPDGLDAIVDVEDIELIIKDEEFICEFNKAIETDTTINLDFANAYRDAMDMVNTRKNSFASAIEIFKGAMIGITEKISPVLSEAAAYGNSQRLTDVAKKG